MPIKNIDQPPIVQINHLIRLRKFDGYCDFALKWYQNEEILKLVDGLNYVKYDMNKLLKMYNFLDNIGELYFIEALENNIYIPIGDVTFCKDDMPIVIGDSSYQGKGIGKLVIQALIDRAKNLGYDEIFVREIYTYNIHSQRLFESVGFKKYDASENGFKYNLLL